MSARRLLVASLLLALPVALVSAEDKKPSEMKMPSPEEMKEMTARMEKAMTPGEPHKKLGELVGEWDVIMKVWMGGPTGPATESKGSAKVTSVLGGRFIREDFKGEMSMPDMATGEMKKLPFEGHGTTGYDNARNLYVGTWIDSMGTQLLHMSGSADPTGKVITMYGQMDEPMLNVVGRMVKYVTRVENKDKHVFEMYDLHAGDNYKVIELTYTRKK